MTGKQGRYVAVSGPIGVGKTFLAKSLSRRMRAHFEAEVFEQNPFLEKLYEPGGIERWGLACEMSFLPPRLAQLDVIRSRLVEGEDVVADWTPYQNLVFSQVTLTESDFQLYKAVFERLTEGFPQPDLVVLLDAPVPTLMDRIRSRGRDMESDMSPAYLMDLREGFRTWSVDAPVPVLPLDTRNLPIPTSLAVRKDVLDRIERTLEEIIGRGRNPRSTGTVAGLSR